MNKISLLSFSICLALSGAAYAAPATTSVADLATLTSHGGEVDVVDQWGITLLDNNAFNYSGDVSVKYKTTGSGRGIGISVFNSLMTLGKTTVVVDVDSAPNANADAVTAVRLKNGSVTVGPAGNDKVTAEFGAGSSFTVNGNGSTEITGLDIEAGPYTSAYLIPEMTITLNENTTVTLNRAGNYSVGLYAYISGAKFITKDGLSINLNSDSAATMYGIRAQGIIPSSSAPVSSLPGAEVELNGTTEIHMLNGGYRHGGDPRARDGLESFGAKGSNRY
ncbi:Uncharacterised protein [Leminorella grimontii]|uniref:hypothetical protein n=1 Tax=Leminorella grimontii TaxID=82981 RepID=UPI00106DACD6|nr:hypothetical protein [Leminorella grimontii]VFS56319.1 Uncharacterised protein [Leminorella grimontii]